MRIPLKIWRKPKTQTHIEETKFLKKNIEIIFASNLICSPKKKIQKRKKERNPHIKCCTKWNEKLVHDEISATEQKVKQQQKRGQTQNFRVTIFSWVKLKRTKEIFVAYSKESEKDHLEYTGREKP